MPKERINISTGNSCQGCGRDSWLVYQGYNRCECGAYLWIEKGDVDDSGHRYRYRQGPALPEGYRGWMQVTQ